MGLFDVQPGTSSTVSVGDSISAGGGLAKSPVPTHPLTPEGALIPGGGFDSGVSPGAGAGEDGPGFLTRVLDNFIELQFRGRTKAQADSEDAMLIINQALAACDQGNCELGNALIKHNRLASEMTGGALLQKSGENTEVTSTYTGSAGQKMLLKQGGVDDAVIEGLDFNVGSLISFERELGTGKIVDIKIGGKVSGKSAAAKDSQDLDLLRLRGDEEGIKRLQAEIEARNEKTRADLELTKAQTAKARSGTKTPEQQEIELRTDRAQLAKLLRNPAFTQKLEIAYKATGVKLGTPAEKLTKGQAKTILQHLGVSSGGGGGLLGSLLGDDDTPGKQGEDEDTVRKALGLKPRGQ